MRHWGCVGSIRGLISSYQSSSRHRGTREDRDVKEGRKRRREGGRTAATTREPSGGGGGAEGGRGAREPGPQFP